MLPSTTGTLMPKAYYTRVFQKGTRSTVLRATSFAGVFYEPRRPTASPAASGPRGSSPPSEVVFVVEKKEKHRLSALLPCTPLVAYCLRFAVLRMSPRQAWRENVTEARLQVTCDKQTWVTWPIRTDKSHTMHGPETSTHSTSFQ